jgi:hypothetical protein
MYDDIMEDEDMKHMIKTVIIIMVLGISFVVLEASKPIDKVLPKQSEVFGIKLYATSSVSDEKIQHAETILKEYLDNNEDGLVDNPLVHKALIDNKAGMILTKNASESMKIMMLNLRIRPHMENLQDLYDDEIDLSGHRFDASLEEVLHLITHVGYAKVYPKVFGEEPGTEIANAMDIARGGHFQDIPSKYPVHAWYSYYDSTADYSTMVTEYMYWSLTSILGAQADDDRYTEISSEWKLNTREKVREQDTKIYELLTNPSYKLPTVLPDGNYNPKKT